MKGKLKLLLVHPCVGRHPGQQKYIRTWKMQPLPPAQVSAIAKKAMGKHVEVSFQDDRFEPIDTSAPADLVCMSVETYTARRCYQIASAYRERNVPVVMGGFHASLCPEEVQRFAESVVVGEAEVTFPQLLDDFQSGKPQRIYSSGERPEFRIKPDRSIYGNRPYLKIGLIEYSRGCRFTCDFCAISSVFKASHTHSDVGQVIEELEEVHRPGELIFFIDDNFASDPDSAMQLCDALKGRGVRWVSQASSTVAWNPDLLDAMRESGCQGVLIGLESLDESALLQMRKGFNLRHGGHSETLARLREARLRVYGTFIFGYDSDTPEVFDRTVDFAISQGLFIAAFNHITPFPGTPLYARLQSEQRLRYDSWWLDQNYRYNEIPFHPAGMDPESLELGCLAARRQFYSLKGIRSRFWNNSNNRLGTRMAFNYWLINLMHQRDVVGRSGLPLGDMNDPTPLREVDR